MFLKSRTFYFFSLLLSVMSDGVYCRSVGERFDMGKSSASNSFMRVVKVLNDIAGDVIVWPRGDRRLAVLEKFQRIGKLSHVIGAIDGTNIPIKAPKVLVYIIALGIEVLIFFRVFSPDEERNSRTQNSN